MSVDTVGLFLAMVLIMFLIGLAIWIASGKDKEPYRPVTTPKPRLTVVSSNPEARQQYYLEQLKYIKSLAERGKEDKAISILKKISIVEEVVVVSNTNR